MKKFVFDRLVDRENICNLKHEADELLKNISQNRNVVIFAPRNFGKTSLLKNMVAADYKKKNPKSFVFFVDLLGVYDMKSLVNRLMIAFENAFADSFPAKNIVENIKLFLKHLSPKLSFDSVTGTPEISLGIDENDKNNSIQYVFVLLNKIAKKTPTLIILDEFQDISEIPESIALFRTAFQELKNSPIIILGSQRQLLFNMFSDPKAPLANWGIDFEIKPINYKVYQDYMNERFYPFKLKIDLDNSIRIQNLMFRVPEAINILCQQIIDDMIGKNKTTEINEKRIILSLKQILINREKRFESIINFLSKTEKSVLIALCRVESIDKPMSKKFTKIIELTPKSIKKIFEKLIQKGMIEKIDMQYRISDPLLHYYLKYNR